MSRRDAREGHAIRWVLSVAALLVAVSALAAVAVPLVVSTELVRDRLENDISQWTGQYVVLGTSPKLAFWPVPSVTFNHVSIMSRQSSRSQPLAVAESVTADFSVISALTGRPRFSNFRLRAPVFTIERGLDGHLNWQTGSGHIARAAEIAAANVAAADSGSKAKQQKVPDYSMGIISISNGTVRFIDKPNDDVETVSALSGQINWPEVKGPGQLDLTGSFRGETVHITASSDKPLMLMAGGNGPLAASFDSKLMSASFSGSAMLTSRSFFKGKLSLQTRSVQKVLQWVGTDIRPGEAIGKLRVDADLTTQRDRLNLDNLIIDIDDNRGIGVLDVQMPKPDFPVVAGTLAFNKLNITSFLRAFTPLPKPGQNIATTIDTQFLHQLGLDLRLSAQSATLGDVGMSDLAAAARIDQGRASFEIGDASAYGGSLTGKVQISEKGLDGGGVVQASARNVDFGALFDALKLKGPLPRGKGTLDLQLKSSHPLWATSSQDITGTLNLKMQNGTIPSFDINAFRSLSAKQRFFDLSRAASGSLAFSSAQFQGQFADGLAEINKGEIRTKNWVIDLNGVLPYRKGSLAMAGSLTPSRPAAKAAENKGGGGKQEEAAKPAPPQPALRFFIGGSWPSPVISPVISQ